MNAVQQENHLHYTLVWEANGGGSSGRQKCEERSLTDTDRKATLRKEGLQGRRVDAPIGTYPDVILSLSAIRAKSGREAAFIFRMTWPRWTLTVISLMPMS
jgi:hypothetical protein